LRYRLYEPLPRPSKGAPELAVRRRCRSVAVEYNRLDRHKEGSCTRDQDVDAAQGINTMQVDPRSKSKFLMRQRAVAGGEGIGNACAAVRAAGRATG